MKDRLLRPERRVADDIGDIKFFDNEVATVSAARLHTLEADKDIGDAFTQLRDNGEVEVVQSVDDLPEEIRGQI